MKKAFRIIFYLITITISGNVSGQFTLDFGNISVEDLSNKPYKPDPGADAIILSETGTVKVEYSDGFYLLFEKDVKIRIVNSNGFDYADVVIPYFYNERIVACRASSFNLRNGTRTETKIEKKDFITEETTKYWYTLKFNFPDVHEGTVIEYSYIVKSEDVSVLVPWDFQSALPIARSSFTINYPEFFSYKMMISGKHPIIADPPTQKSNFYGGLFANTNINRWYASNIPAFKTEPYIKNMQDNLTGLTFELSSVKYPNSSTEEISPTYEKLTTKLLERNDFGSALEKTLFLAKPVSAITAGMNDNLSKAKAIYRHVAEKVLWDGEEYFAASKGLRQVYTKRKGNSAEINMILIGMLRSAGIKAEPVILSTRSNGSISQGSAMLQQFNYVVANVTIEGENYLMDATDPLRPFNMLPYECLNMTGWQISLNDSRFMNLRNSEKNTKKISMDLTISSDGEIQGSYMRRVDGYPAYNIRRQLKIEGHEGYASMMKANYSEVNISDFIVNNIAEPDSAIVENFSIRMNEKAYQAGSRLILNPYLSFSAKTNPFIMPEREFPVDFGCPQNEEFTLSLRVPSGYSIEEIPAKVKYSVGVNDCSYQFSCDFKGDEIFIRSSMQINKTVFTPLEYESLRDFYAKMLESQSRMIVLKKTEI